MEDFCLKSGQIYMKMKSKHFRWSKNRGLIAEIEPSKENYAKSLSVIKNIR